MKKSHGEWSTHDPKNVKLFQKGQKVLAIIMRRNSTDPLLSPRDMQQWKHQTRKNVNEGFLPIFTSLKALDYFGAERPSGAVPQAARYYGTSLLRRNPSRTSVPHVVTLDAQAKNILNKLFTAKRNRKRVMLGMTFAQEGNTSSGLFEKTAAEFTKNSGYKVMVKNYPWLQIPGNQQLSAMFQEARDRPFILLVELLRNTNRNNYAEVWGTVRRFYDIQDAENFLREKKLL